MTGEKQCNCMKSPFADLPPEMRPKPQKKSLLRKTTCLGCGREYWTNRSVDLCFGCEEKDASTIKTKSQSEVQ